MERRKLKATWTAIPIKDVFNEDVRESIVRGFLYGLAKLTSMENIEENIELAIKDIDLKQGY